MSMPAAARVLSADWAARGTRRYGDPVPGALPFIPWSRKSSTASRTV